MKPSVPKGTRDFGSDQVLKRQHITSKIKYCFEHFGFFPIETPSFENLSTLMGKYGAEGDKLIFKILNSGNFLSDIDPKDMSDANALLPHVSEKALRYDLTIPFARFVVQHKNDLVFPFKRYQIQPVWRADRPQKGRYREFYQCDADVVGADSLAQEVEFVMLYDAVFKALGFAGVSIRINNRKIIAGICERLDIVDRFKDFTILLDKLDKIGLEKVLVGFADLGINQEDIQALRQLFQTYDLKQFKTFLQDSSVGQKGIEEISFVVETIREVGLFASSLVFDPTLARGLDYYTGCIFEVMAPEEVALGSIGGGGRYDNLTETFGLADMSGVGISFGLDRIYLAMEQLELFPDDLRIVPNVLFLNMEDTSLVYIYKTINYLRKQGLSTDFYPQPDKLKKQLAYADKKGVRYVVIVGPDEVSQEIYTLKDMQTGEQESLNLQQISEKIQRNTVSKTPRYN